MIFVQVMLVILLAALVSLIGIVVLVALELLKQYRLPAIEPTYEPAAEAQWAVTTPDNFLAVDPTDGIIPDVYDPLFRGSGDIGIRLDGDISQAVYPEDDQSPPPGIPTIMPDGTVVLNGEIISHARREDRET